MRCKVGWLLSVHRPFTVHVQSTTGINMPTVHLRLSSPTPTCVPLLQRRGRRTLLCQVFGRHKLRRTVLPPAGPLRGGLYATPYVYSNLRGEYLLYGRFRECVNLCRQRPYQPISSIIIKHATLYRTPIVSFRCTSLKLMLLYPRTLNVRLF